MAFPEDILSSTPAKYLFKLMSDVETITCNPEPLEWESGSLEIKRDLDCGGVFISFLCDSLTFVGNGAEFLRNLFIYSELNAKCTLIIYYWKNIDVSTPSLSRRYVEFPTRFNIDFNFYEIVKIGKFNFGVRVKAVNNSVQTKLDSRQDIDIDITKSVSIGGTTLINYPTLKMGLYYSATNIFYSAWMAKYTDSSQFQHIADVVSYSSIPLNKISSQFTELQTVGYMTKQTNLTIIPSFFKNALYDYDELEIYCDITITVDDRWNGSNPFELQVLETKEIGGVTTIINTYTLGAFGNTEGNVAFAEIINITLTKGNSLKLVVYNGGIDAQYHAHSIRQILTVVQRVAETPATQTQGYPVYEATEKLLQHILDVQYPFYSEYFGRTDVKYNALNNVYSSENQLRFAHIQLGLNQRGLSFSDPETSLILNFKDLFKSLKAIWNVGYMFDSSIDGFLRLRIEEYSYFFQDIEVLDLSSRINKYDIQSQVMPELVPNDLKSGFDSYEYLSLNGRGEPNTTNQRTSVMNTSTKFENISILRGDTKGIMDNLSNPILGDETIDTKGDSDIFIIKTQKDAVYNWKPEKAENITIASGSLFGEDLMNRYFTPSRMLIRHGNRIKSGMTKLSSTDVLRFQKSDKSNSLETTGTAGIENYTIKESDDILVSSLANPIYKPIKHTVDCLFTQIDLELLQATPLGYITFSSDISGYLLSLKKKNNEDKATITIIERYI